MAQGAAVAGDFPDAGNLRIDRAVLERFPDLRIGILRVDVRNDAATDRLAGLRAQAAADIRARGRGGEDDPYIAAWQATYRQFGTNPRRSRPSAEALCRRLRRGGELPRINDVVDIYNVVSVESRLPCGAYDTERLLPPVRLTFAEGGERFRPIGAVGDDADEVGPGEVIYLDRGRVLTRHWNHRDCDDTKVSPRTKSVLVLCEAADPAIPTPAVDAALGRLRDLLREYCDATVRYRGVLRGPSQR